MDPGNYRANDEAVLEKSLGTVDLYTPSSDVIDSSTATRHIPATSRFKRWNNKIENLAGFEARGIVRVPPEERHAESLNGYLQMALIWFSVNLSVNNLAVGLLGPLLFELGFVDSALCCVFGLVLGSVSTAYMSTWGAVSGNRTLVCSSMFISRVYVPFLSTDLSTY